jgi:hypothetical protein
MTGPEHYREAERIVGLASGKDIEVARSILAEARVHATLALAAATAEAGRLSQNATGLSPTPWRTALHGEEGRS